MPITKRSLIWSNNTYWYTKTDGGNTYEKEITASAAEALAKRFGLRIVYRVRRRGVWVRITQKEALGTGKAVQAAIKTRVDAALAKAQRTPTARAKPTPPWARHHAMASARIHDNGGVPWIVFYNEAEAHIYQQESYKVPILKRNYRLCRASFSVQRLFAPNRRYRHAGQRVHDTGTVLFQLDDGRWVYVGRDAMSFSADEHIESFHSPIGNNDVPYPYALGRKYVYLLLDGLRVKRDKFPAETAWEKDVYDEYYELLNRAKRARPKQPQPAEPIADWRVVVAQARARR